MAFEIVHPKLEFENLSPVRRAGMILLGVLFLLGRAWSCATVLNAVPVDAPASGKAAASPAPGRAS